MWNSFVKEFVHFFFLYFGIFSWISSKGLNVLSNEWVVSVFLIHYGIGFVSCAVLVSSFFKYHVFTFDVRFWCRWRVGLLCLFYLFTNLVILHWCWIVCFLCLMLLVFLGIFYSLCKSFYCVIRKDLSVFLLYWLVICKLTELLLDLLAWECVYPSVCFCMCV